MVATGSLRMVPANSFLNYGLWLGKSHAIECLHDKGAI